MSRIRAGFVSGVWVLLLFVAVFGVVLNVPVVWGSGTIYIRADGSIDPPTAPIQRIGNIYTFISNTSDEVEVERNNTIIDGNGHSLQGSGSGNGFYLYRVANVTIRNTNIKGFWSGIFLSYSLNSVISKNNVTANNGNGIVLMRSSDNRISENNVTVNPQYGIRLQESSSNVLRDNTMTGNRYNFMLEGRVWEPSDYVNDVDSSNIVDQRMVYYWVGRQYDVVPSEAGYVVLVNCTNIEVGNLTLAKNGQGIFLAYTVDSTITGNNITNNEYNGIELCYSSRNTISRNNVTANHDYGISLYSHSNNNSIFGNSITANNRGLALLFSSNNNSMTQNNIANNGCGIALVSESSNNVVYHNNFVNNTLQTMLSPDSMTSWDNGYPSGGNYWSNYTGADSNADGIGDTPHVINENNQDNYPLMNLWGLAEEEVPFWMQWWFYAIVAVAVVALGGAVYFLKKRKPHTNCYSTPTEST